MSNSSRIVHASGFTGRERRIALGPRTSFCVASHRGDSRIGVYAANPDRSAKLSVLNP